jgi:hypothetical protein
VSIDVAGPLPGDYGVTAAQLEALDVPGGMVIVGNSKSTGGINIGATGAVDLSGINYSLGLAGLSGGVNFYNALTLAAGSLFDLNTGSSVVNGFSPILDISIPNGTLSFSSSGGVGSSGQPLNTNVGFFGASAITGSVYLDNSSSGVSTVISGAFSVLGEGNSLEMTSAEGLISTYAIQVGGQSIFNLNGLASDFSLSNSKNNFVGKVSINGRLNDMTIVNQTSSRLVNGVSVDGAGLFMGNLVASGNVNVTVTGAASTDKPQFTFDSIQAVGNVTISSKGLTGGTLDTATLGGAGKVVISANSGDVTLNSTGNLFGFDVFSGYGLSITGAKNVQVYIPAVTDQSLGPVTATGSFKISTDAGFVLPATGSSGAEFDLTNAQLSNISVQTLSLNGTGDIQIPTAFYYPNIQNLNLVTSGSVNAEGAITVGTLTVSSAGSATLNALNSISNLGNVTTLGGNFSFINGRQLNLAGAVSVIGDASVTVAGQFYNTSGQALPFAGTTGRAVVRSLSMMGGLPNQISALAGFTPSYNFTDPGTSRAMIYAVSPLSQFAPSGTMIAGVNLGGTQTGGGQFNTFLTGSDNLNWMISDFGRFDMPTVKPSGMDYILYPQRVEPETRTLPAAVLGQLEQELGRPPTLDEIQAREVAVREAAIVRSGAILERTSFDAIEDETDKQESAEVPVQVIDGAKPQAGGPSFAPSPASAGGASEGFGPQADARGQRPADGMQKAEVGSRPSFAPSPASAGGASEGFGPQARKTQSVKQGASGPILRSGPIRSVAHLRPAEPPEGASAGKTVTQAANLDAKSVMEQERASAEVGIAPPIAAGR